MLIRYKTELESVREDQKRPQHPLSFVTVRNSTVTRVVTLQNRVSITFFNS
jgi:hypothetical protein